MTAWTTWSATYTENDVAAFENPRLINSHFGLPLPFESRVFSVSLTPEGQSNVHEGLKKYRSTYFGNTWAYRHIKAKHPDAWIWDERYRFSRSTVFCSDTRICDAQAEFIKLFGRSRIQEIRAMALREGLDPDKNNGGRPDLAVHFPGQDVPWRFMEIKILETGDTLRADQKKWLQLFASSLGTEAAVLLELRRT
jgi:hypothetical protein